MTITTVAELEPYGLDIKTLAILEAMGVIYLDDLEHIGTAEIWKQDTGGDVAIKNIREALRNYLAGRIVQTGQDLMFPPDSKGRSRK